VRDSIFISTIVHYRSLSRTIADIAAQRSEAQRSAAVVEMPLYGIFDWLAVARGSMIFKVGLKFKVFLFTTFLHFLPQDRLHIFKLPSILQYTVSHKNKTLSITSPNIERFSQFSLTLAKKFGIKRLLTISPLLKSVATLTCEILISENVCRLCRVRRGIVLLKYQLARDLRNATQQLL